MTTATETYTTYAVRYWVVGRDDNYRLNVVIPSSQGVTADTLLAVLRQTCGQEAGVWGEGMVEVTHYHLIDTP